MKSFREKVSDALADYLGGTARLGASQRTLATRTLAGNLLARTLATAKKTTLEGSSTILACYDLDMILDLTYVFEH